MTKISMKNVYLLFMIPILLIGLGIGSTLAMFNAEATIENPISFRSNLSYDSSVVETKEVIIPYKSDRTIDFVISNTLDRNLNFDAWYIVDENNKDNVMLGAVSSVEGYATSGVISGNTSFVLSITLRNTSDEDVTVTIGVSSTSESKLVLPKGAKDIPYGLLPPLEEEKEEITDNTNSNLEDNKSNQDITTENNIDKDDTLSSSD